MRSKLALAGIVVALLVAIMGGTALSAPPDGLESYDAGATTTAFALGLGPESLAGGLTLAELSSAGPVSSGDGSALLLFGTDMTENGRSAAPEGPAQAEDCALDEELPDPIDLLGLEIGCVRSTAPDTEHATSASESATISVLGAGLTEELVDALLAPVIDGLTPVLEGANELVGALCEALPLIGEECVVSDVVDQVVEGLDADAEILTVAVAPGGSSVTADENGVVAEAISNGVVVKVLPNALLYGRDELGKANGAVTIRIAPARATAIADPVTGAITTSASVGLIEAQAGNPITDNALGELLGLDVDDALINTLTETLNDIVGQLADANALACGADSPLADIVCLSAAQAEADLSPGHELFLDGFDYGDGTLGARATTLGLQLLSAAQEGGLVSLYLSDAFAAVNASPAGAPPPTVTAATPTTVDELPRTGGTSTPMLAIVAGLAGAFLVVRMRNRFGSTAL